MTVYGDITHSNVYVGVWAPLGTEHYGRQGGDSGATVGSENYSFIGRVLPLVYQA